MRVAIDALGAPPTGGGMRAYVEHLLDAWSAEFPDDRLLLVGYAYLERFRGERCEVVVRPPTTSSRIVGQWVGAGRLANRWGADALLSTSTVVSPVFRGPRACVVHDWRHRQRPEEFSAAARAYRRSWAWSATHADVVVQISEKTLGESRRHLPRATLELVPNGRDHAAAWGLDPLPVPGTGRVPHVVTFGHAVNKRPDLVLAAVARLPEDHRLTVLGARGAAAERLGRAAAELGLTDRLTLPGFVPDEVYRQTVRAAGVVVLASTDEGFGLPVCEAEQFGIPVVVTDDSGLGEIHGDRVVVSAADPAALAGAISAALARPVTPSETVVWGWRDTARGIRQALEDAC